MKNCKQCDECLANSICANWVTPIAKVCSIFLEAVDALKTARNKPSAPLPACITCAVPNCGMKAGYCGLYKPQ
jgi:hypothetical protein